MALQKFSSSIKTPEEEDTLLLEKRSHLLVVSVRRSGSSVQRQDILHCLHPAQRARCDSPESNPFSRTSTGPPAAAGMSHASAEPLTCEDQLIGAQFSSSVPRTKPNLDSSLLPLSWGSGNLPRETHIRPDLSRVSLAAYDTAMFFEI